MNTMLNKIKSLFVLVVTAFALLTNNVALAQDPEGSRVEWMNLKTAWENYQKVPKPILIDFYTDWCGWCKRMMSTTYAQQDIAGYINVNFYPVKFNAEGKDTIEWLGKKYIPTSAAPRTAHPFAVHMLGGRLSYPTTIFLNGYNPSDSSFMLNMIAPGYLDPQNIEPALVFSLENAYRNSSYEDFNREFKMAFNDSVLTARGHFNKWLSPSEILNVPQTERRKTMMLITTPWCNSGKIMSKTSFSDPGNMAYIDSTYKLAIFNPEITDTLSYLGNIYTNKRVRAYPFHELAYELSNKALILPTLVILDEDMKLLDAIPFYLPPALLGKIAHFYGDDAYKTMNWVQFFEKTTTQ